MAGPSAWPVPENPRITALGRGGTGPGSVPLQSWVRALLWPGQARQRSWREGERKALRPPEPGTELLTTGKGGWARPGSRIPPPRSVQPPQTPSGLRLPGEQHRKGAAPRPHRRGGLPSRVPAASRPPRGRTGARGPLQTAETPKPGSSARLSLPGAPAARPLPAPRTPRAPAFSLRFWTPGMRRRLDRTAPNLRRGASPS